MLNGHKPTIKSFLSPSTITTAIRPSACRISTFLGFYYLKASAATTTMKSDSQNSIFLKSPFCVWKTDVRAKQAPCAPDSTDENDMRRIYVHDDDRVLLKVQNLPHNPEKIICVICCLSSNRHTLIIIQPHGKSQKTIIPLLIL
jgi:hypothetical protein